jgi:superfamily II DNA or RNA helicase
MTPTLPGLAGTETAVPINLLWGDGVLTVAPAPRCVTNYLRYTEKKFVDGGKRISRETVELFTTVSKSKFGPVIETAQGYCRPLEELLRSEGYEVIVHDKRLEFPEPKLNHTHGFRFSQQSLLHRFLQANMSGILAAPTRYGKTTLIINTLRAYYGFPIVVIVPGIDLVGQMFAEIHAALPKRKVTKLGAGSRVRIPSDDITVCSMDSLHLIDHAAVRLVLIDEVQDSVTDSRLPEFEKFQNARILGFSATPSGRFDGRDLMIIGLIGPILVERTYKEAVAEGAISPLMVYFLKVKIPGSKYRDRLFAYRNILYRNHKMARLIKGICDEIVPQDWQTIVFIKEEPQALLLLEQLGPDGTIAMAKRLPKKKEREDVLARIKSDQIRRVLATVILSKGITMSRLRCMINAESGGPYCGSIQKPGRLAEVRPDIPDKKYGVIFDFLFECDDPGGFKNSDPAGGLKHEAWSRINAYKAKGYEIRIVDTFAELMHDFQTTHLLPYAHLRENLAVTA